MQAAAVHAAHDGDDTGHMSALVGKLFKGLASKKRSYSHNCTFSHTRTVTVNIYTYI